MTDALVVGPTAAGAAWRSPAAAWSPRRRRARRVSPAPTARSRRARSAPTPISTAASRATACRRPSRRRETSCEILERVWWRLDRALDARASPPRRATTSPGAARRRDDARRSSRIAEPDRGFAAVLAEACAEFGVRALLCYGATERNVGRDEARRGLDACRRRRRLAARARPRRAARDLHGVRRHDPRGRRAGARARDRRARARRRGPGRRRRRAPARLRRAAPAPDGARRAAAGLDPRARRASERPTR